MRATITTLLQLNKVVDLTKVLLSKKKFSVFCIGSLFLCRSYGGNNYHVAGSFYVLTTCLLMVLATKFKDNDRFSLNGMYSRLVGQTQSTN